ncbi:MAG TPA: hypothetical protein ENK06_13865 [Gammaproteobacteria bacterium]|nr:hypothetical protein [Gammaproteobacteria bacterium]
MSTQDILAELQQSYLTGIPSHLEEMENMVLNLEKNHDYQENFDALYRKVHSLKGSGATYGFNIITSVCHQFEDFISDELQTKTRIPPPTINKTFAYIDILKNVHSLLKGGDDAAGLIQIEKQLQALQAKNTQSRLRAILIDPPEKMYKQICIQTLIDANVSYVTTNNSLTAFQRLLNEPFDLLITPRENAELSGTALIAALKLNKRCNINIKSILITSNPNLGVPDNLQPSLIILKGMNFSEKLKESIDAIVLESTQKHTKH